jgi:hypothetical protein
MTVQITRRQRAENAERPPGGWSDSLAYFGRYEKGFKGPWKGSLVVRWPLGE